MSSVNPTKEQERRHFRFFTKENSLVVASLIFVSGAAWLYMILGQIHMNASANSMSMADMWMPPTGGEAWALSDFWLTFVMWTVMMIAMMVPSAIPVVAMFATINRKRFSSRKAIGLFWIFLLGYVIAWSGFSAIVTIMQWPLHKFSLLTPMMDNNSQLLAAVILILAGLYQWTPFKDACLSYCRTPLAFVMTEWREGARGALIMGTRHGLFCVGCCWVLMLVLFAVGVMNLIWVAAIAIFVILEKVSPGGPWLIRVPAGVLLVAWGLSILVLT